MFCSDVTLKLKDICAYGPGSDLFTDSRYIIRPWVGGPAFIVLQNNIVKLGDKTWGTAKEFLDLDIVEIGFNKEGRFCIRVDANF